MTVPRTDRQKIRIAIIGLTALAFFFGLAINFQRLPFLGAGTGYRAEFTDASGLVPGEEVRVAGIKVGTVTGIALALEPSGARVVVSFTVKGVDLGVTTTAGIEVKTLLGQHYLSVTPSGGGALPANAVIPLSRTKTPVNIVPAFQQLATEASGIDTKQVAAAFDALSQTLQSTAPEMTQTLRGLSRISRAVTSRDIEIRALFARASMVSRVVASRDADIAQLLTDTNTVLAELHARRDTITRIIAGTSGLARQLSGLVTDNRAQLGPALTKLNDVLAVLRKNKANIDQAIQVGLVYGREFVNVGGSGRWFDASVKAPQGAAVCATGGLPGSLDSLFGGILSQINKAANGSTTPCLPLGPAVARP